MELVTEEELPDKITSLELKGNQLVSSQNAALGRVQADIEALRLRLQAAMEMREEKRKMPIIPVDNALVTRVEWTVDNARTLCGPSGKKQGDSIVSPFFKVMGVDVLQFEFFPTGRQNNMEGFCALFLWCSAGTRIKYQLQIGPHRTEVDRDDYPTWCGRGHSNFCYVGERSDVFNPDGSVQIAVEIFEFQRIVEQSREREQDDLAVITTSPAAVVREESGLLYDRDVKTVEWTIKDIRKRLQLYPRGQCLCSPVFCIAGLRCHLLFYPNGDLLGEGQAARAGYCGYYFYSQQAGTVTLTMAVGAVRKPPAKAILTRGGGKGHPEFCKLDDALEVGDVDLKLSVSVDNTQLEWDEANSVLVL
eukprot:TRINITY_DN45268_c0_g1_i2.p1 TRINITY_DN45268_c0_g1~~TRINITY_DN45268_c0_g1_i2.p1  ORF type:complete len:362 (+),score=65.81 TRINITY_DN45268_c0_g1_i2:114-1199(+)